MRHPRAGLVQHVFFVFVQVYAMHRNGARPQDLELAQPLDHAQVILAQAFVFVGLVLGHVDVEAGAQALRCAGRCFQRLVRQGERGVEAEGGGQLRVGFVLAAFDEAHVLGDAGRCAGHAVAVGHFVAQAGAQAGLLDRVRDDVQAAVNHIRAGMVVNQRRAAVADRVGQADQRAVLDVIPQQRPVELPPEPLQDLDEVRGGRAGDRHAAGERAVEVRVPADRAGQDELAARVQPLGRRIPGGQAVRRADRRDGVALDVDRAVGDQLVALAQGEDLAVGD